LSDESSVDHACCFVASDSDSNSESLDDEYFCISWVKDSRTGEYSGDEGDSSRTEVVNMFWINGVGVCRELSESGTLGSARF
jgi:hypothetical protein